MKLRNVLSVAAVLGAVALMACQGDTIVNVGGNTTTQSQAGGAPSPRPTPEVGAGSGAGAIVFVRTGFFGGSCTNGGEVRNGAPMKIGCTGFATATPLGAGDVKLGPDVHGYECKWTVDNPQVVQLLDVGDNPFNIDVRALAVGTAHITATVKGITGSFDVTVVQ